MIINKYNKQSQKTGKYMSNHTLAKKIKPLQSSYSIRSRHKSSTLARNKRAASVWIAYVLLVAFVVSLSAIMFSFMTDYTRSSTKNIKKTVFNTDECRSVALSIESVCFSSQVLNITVKNRNYLRIDEVDVRLYDSKNKPLGLNITNVSLNPNREKIISINTGFSSLGFVEVIPRVIKEDVDGPFDIVCDERRASTTNLNSSC